MGQMQRLIDFFAHPRIVFYTFPWLMFLVAFGTVVQKDIGLYRAEQLYFSSVISWIGPVPVPGMVPTLGVVAISLLVKLIFKSPWSLQRAGVLITHMGVFLLIGGGLITAVTTEEGYLSLLEGARSGEVYDYHAREVVILKNDQILFRMPLEDIAIGQELGGGDLPFQIRVKTVCRNCEPVQRARDQDIARGMSGQFDLEPQALKPQDEDNTSGLVFLVSGVGVDQDGLYLAYEPVDKFPSVVLGEDRYEFRVGRVRRDLPFEVELIDFEKQVYPGTAMAREYQSFVRVHDGTVSFETFIRMNEPLRYQGYTVYQSSFLVSAAGETSVFAVVKNQGRVFPYVSSLIIFIGLLVHLFVRRPKRRDAMPPSAHHACDGGL